ncbi:MAG: UAA transporter [Cyphobasidiales sp. Tagirdzhanova-0007]|nr:MAG: UAA transporter [Cyphobasidiales sp. Tagirdzhanova-0007]
MAYSPVTDPGYASASSTPWLASECSRFEDGSNQSCDKFLQVAGEAGCKPSNGGSNGLSAPVGLHSAQSATWTASPVGLAATRAYTSLAHTIGGTGLPKLSLYPLSSAANSADSSLGGGHSSAPRSSYASSFRNSTAYWLLLYFFFNLSLTLYNKFALGSFPFPWTLTCLHSLSASIGSWAAYKRGYFQRSAALQSREQLVLIAFSTLYTVNIAVSNLSLNLVSVPLHQVVRSTTPLFTMVISICMFKKTYLLQTYLSLIPVIAGVCLATYGDYSCTAWGLFLTLLGALLAAVKGIETNRILVGRLKFHPLDLLLRMSPLAFVQCLVFSYMSGELSQVYERTFVSHTLGQTQWLSLFVNGGLAFGLNVVSFTANKKSGALTMSVAANVKQVLTIVLAVLIFNVAINRVNLLGISSTIAGGAYYSYIEYKSKRPRLSISLSDTSLHLGNPAFPHTYYEKKSPLPTTSENPMEQAQYQAQAQAQTQNGSHGEDCSYHRRTNSLTVFREFQYPRQPQQEKPHLSTLLEMS